MNNIYKIFLVFVLGVTVVSCSKNSDSTEPLRDYQTQFVADSTLIDSYLNTHYLTFDSSYNVTFDTITTANPHLSIRHDHTFHLSDTLIAQNGINYKVYFIKFREGTEKRPTQVDSIHVAYRGTLLTGTQKQFDAAVTPVWFNLQQVISGWASLLPGFKTGTYTPASGGNSATFDNYGAGVMFLPSGLGYYNSAAGIIPAYSPIIFSFKLLELQYRDQDGDGILSKDERKLPSTIPTSIRWKENPYLGFDFDGDGVVDIYDTDGDGIPNMYDVDDDGDNYLTRYETIKLSSDITTASPLGHYPFNPTATEPKGVPRKFTGPVDPATGLPTPQMSDYTDPTRLRRYLDPTSFPPYQ